MNTPQPTPPPVPSQADLDELTAWHTARDAEELAILADRWDSIAAFIYAHEDLRPQGPDWEAGLMDVLANVPLRLYPTQEYLVGATIGWQLLSAADYLNAPPDERTRYHNPPANAIYLCDWLDRHAA